MSRRSRLLNKHIEVFWEPTNLWYGGTVTKYSKGKYLVKYDILNDDGSWEQEWSWFKTEKEKHKEQHKEKHSNIVNGSFDIDIIFFFFFYLFYLFYLYFL